MKGTLTALLSCTLLAASCQFRPLAEIGNTHYVRIYLDDADIQNTTSGFYREDMVKPQYERPEIMMVSLADPRSGRIVAERYLRDRGTDERGCYYEGYIICDPGEWQLMARNFDTKSTRIEGENNIRTAKAYTNKIASHLYGALFSRLSTKGDDNVVYEPDHLFVAECPEVKVGGTGQIDTLRTAEGDFFTASTIVESWYLQIKVKGISRLGTAVTLIDGLAGSKELLSGNLDPADPVTLYFEMSNGFRTKSETDEGVIYATFFTFGKIPESKSNLIVTFDVVTTYGKPMSFDFDITDEFDKPAAKDHRWILMDEEIEIPEGPPPGVSGGGMDPKLDEWQDVSTDIII